MSRRKREITGLMNEWDFPHLLELPPGGFRSVFLEFDTHSLIVCATLEFRQLSVVVGGDGRHVDLVVIFLHELDVGRKLDRPRRPQRQSEAPKQFFLFAVRNIFRGGHDAVTYLIHAMQKAIQAELKGGAPVIMRYLRDIADALGEEGKAAGNVVLLISSKSYTARPGQSRTIIGSMLDERVDRL